MSDSPLVFRTLANCGTVSVRSFPSSLSTPRAREVDCISAVLSLVMSLVNGSTTSHHCMSNTRQGSISLEELGWVSEGKMSTPCRLDDSGPDLSATPRWVRTPQCDHPIIPDHGTDDG